MAQVKCPNPDCQTVSPIPDAYLGRMVRCRKCNTRFKAEVPPTETTSPVESDIVTVVARRVGAQAGVAQLEAMTASAAAPRLPAGQRIGAVLALVLPILAAALFVGIRALGDRKPAADVYGGIEISSTAVKATVVELYPDKELGYDYQIRWKKEFRTLLMQGLEKSNTFDPDALRDTADAVQAFSQQMIKDHGVPADKIFIVAGSGLLKEIRRRKGLDEAAREKLLRSNEAALSAAVKKATGNDVQFVDVRKEVELQIGGLVPQRLTDSSLLIDIGSGATRGGYRDGESGLYVTFEIPGVKSFGSVVAAQGGKEPRPELAAQLAGAELREPFRKHLERREDTLRRRRIYLNGGLAWIMTTYQQPAKRDRVHVPLSAADVKSFTKLLREHPKLPPFVPPAGLAPKLDELLKKDAKRIPKIFKPAELLAGAEILDMLSTELRLGDPGTSVFFTSDGEISWLLGYIAEHRATKP